MRVSSHHFLTAVLQLGAASFLSACAAPASTTTAPQSVADESTRPLADTNSAQTDTASSKEAKPSVYTGALDEASFVALHQYEDASDIRLSGKYITLSDGSRAYLSLPKNAIEPAAAVVVFHEWWGLNSHIALWADRLAELGYATLAVDLYHGKVATAPQDALALMKSVDQAQALQTMRAAYSFVKDDPQIKAQRTASIGWCFGGRQSLLFALDHADLDAAVIYYGHIPTDEPTLAPLRAPILAVFGTQDESIPLAQVEIFEKMLGKLHVEHTVLTFDAPHAFANPSGPNYAGEASKAAWEATQKFLAKHLQPKR